MDHIDLIGKQFQQLEVLERAPDYIVPDGRKTAGTHIRMWRCKCLLCGDEVVTRESSLLSGHIKSCGRKHRQVRNLSGMEFHDLKVIERAPNMRNARGDSYVMWKCVCKCGNTTVVRATSLLNGHTKSCGICSRSRSNMGKGVDDIMNREFGYWKVLSQSRSLIEPRGRRVILWKCQCRCGEIRELRAGTLKSGLSLSCGCHKLDVLRARASHGFGMSKAEIFVNTWLSDAGYYYEPRKMYPDLRGDSGYPLSYDFLVYTQMEPLLLIECQGRQHYEAVGYFGGESRFEVQQKNDDCKRKYAVKLGIPLLEIPYTCSDEADIIRLLKQYL